MAQTAVQYTPVQVLQAARRAEAEGKMDYALQFYRHIVEHHGTSAEAQEAREGLFRIAEWRWGEARIARRQEAGGGQGKQQAAQAQQRPAAASTQQTYAPEPAESSVPVTGATRMPQIIAREAERQADEHHPATPPSARFRGAWLAAVLLSGCGWAIVVTGIVIAILALGGGTAELAEQGMLGIPLGVALGVPAAVIGLVLIVGGLLAIAVLESTNATLELLAMRQRKQSS